MTEYKLVECNGCGKKVECHTHGMPGMWTQYILTSDVSPESTFTFHACEDCRNAVRSLFYETARNFGTTLKGYRRLKNEDAEGDSVGGSP